MSSDNQRIELFSKTDIGNHPVFDAQGEDKRLFDAIRNEELIVFYGAGVSMLGGCASWSELARNIVNAYPSTVFSKQEKTILNQMSENDPRQVISICYNKTQGNNELERIYYRKIRYSVKPRKKLLHIFKEIHAKLFRLKAISYITTNIDKGMERIDSVDLQNKNVINLTKDTFDLTREIKNGNIFYLHGSIDSLHDTIFSVHSYHNFYAGVSDNSQSKVVKEFLMNIFRGDYCVLFVGYGLEEQEILQSIFTATTGTGQLQGQTDYKHFWLAPVYTKDLAEFNIKRMYYDIYSVKGIPYFIDHTGYEGLNGALDKLRSEFEQYQPDPISIFESFDL